MNNWRLLSWTVQDGRVVPGSVVVDDGRVFDETVVKRCIVDSRPASCVEIEPGIWFYLPFIVQPEPTWRPYEPCKEGV